MLWTRSMCLQNDTGGCVEGWKEAVKAGEILLFDEERAKVMRYAPGGGAVEGAGVGRAVPAGGASGEGSPGGMMGMVFSASTTVRCSRIRLSPRSCPPFEDGRRLLKVRRRLSVPPLVPVSNLCAVPECFCNSFFWSFCGKILSSLL